MKFYKSKLTVNSCIALCSSTNAVSISSAHVFAQPKVQPHFLRWRVGDGAGRFIYAGGALSGSSVTVVPSCLQEAINAIETKIPCKDSMYFLIGSEFSDRVPQNVKLPQAQRRFQRVAFALLSVEAKSHMRNGNTDGQITVEALQVAFKDRPDLLFRHFPEATVAMMRWQCGRTASDVVEFPDGYGAMIAGRQVTALDTNTSGARSSASPYRNPSPGDVETWSPG
jgi:hypothetical protein